MRAEVVGVGTELLLGQIANTNAQFISDALAAIGVDVYLHTAVGDNLARMTEVLAASMERSDVVIVTGGLGPTPDDITREGIAAATGTSLVRDERLVKWLEDFFASRQRSMPASNLRQADRPDGAIAIEPEGTAPGFYLDAGSCLFVALPGVPWEMKAMMSKSVIPLLRERAGDVVTLSREVMVIGVGESDLDETIGDIVAAQSNPTIAYLAGGGRVRVRLTAQAPSEPAADALIGPVEASIRDRLGKHAVPGHHADLAEALGALLRERGATVAVAESLTGGSIGAALTEAPGASDYFLGSLVVYTEEAKRTVGGIDAGVLAEHGVVSAEVASALAVAAAERFAADLGLGATGVAGPDEHGGRSAGTVFVGATYGGRTEARRVPGYGDRSNVRAIAVTAALDLGRRMVSGVA